MTQKDEQKARSRAAILDSAMVRLREHGIKASSVADVMKGAGLTVGGFYGHFGSKEELFAESIRVNAGKAWDQMLRAARGATPRARAVSVVNRYLSRTHRDDAGGGCLLPSAAAEVARDGEHYRAALEEQLTGFIDSFAELLGTRKEHHEEALATIALMYGALSLSRAMAGTPLSDEILLAARKLAERSLVGHAS